jgi:hypothetical protein
MARNIDKMQKTKTAICGTNFFSESEKVVKFIKE